MNRAFIAVFGIAVFAAILFGSLAFDSVFAAPQPKVTICHVDPDGDGAGNETLEVSNKAVEKHLAHGDGEGACLTCGNGLVEAGEVCDDGNNNNDDGCNATCDSDETCGNGFVDPIEECDDGNTNDNDSCTNQCTTAVCGDGIVGPGEQCDGSELDGKTCENFEPNDDNIEGYLDSNPIGYLGLPNGGLPNGGFPNGGELACFGDCTFDTRACRILIP